ncbi:LuxR C-terminal-related transcriptional regulator [Actinomadura sp. 7K534]|uniref:ATP-binding protein n=1 Tax=Actinomadura sp. 7K534 TaxID=2530366 RepID=UPI00104A5001|nr:LuxR C-terminal-related transcriptional regulator [Actinomadura sp. 7K534]TDB99245.1 ATPase [Actinomadura sp. 7K534]
MTRERPVEITEREAEVLAALGARLSNAQIAGRLHISVRTVESHISSLLRKYGVADRWALADEASRRTPPPGHLSGLPAPRTAFFGRAAELDLALGLFGDTRLVTLLGTGGIGKTRLAVAVAESAASAFPLGGAFVDLVPVRDGFVAEAVASALGVTERPGQALEDAVARHLGRGRSLLVLDNCEHLLDAVAAFTERLLSGCAAVTVLTTGRERLGVPGERTVPVPPLPLDSDAERLFLDRAAAADPGFTADPADVRELCRRLDGMPLAIELAAARSASLGAPGLLAALDDVLRLLSGGRGSVARHRSLRAVLGWSHDLLTDDERVLFRRLSVFAGAFDLATAAAVAADPGTAAPGRTADLLGRLVDKSLVAGPARGRWRLPATVRAFAAERLEAAGEGDAVRDRHLRWATETAAELEDRLDGRMDGGTRAGFDAVADDLRSALAGAPPGRAVVPHRLARSLAHLTYARRFLREVPGHYEEAARRAPDPGEAAADLRAAADAAHALIDTGRAFELLLAAADRARAAGAGNAEAVALAFAVTTAERHPSGFAAEIPHGRLRDLLAAAASAGDDRDPLVAAHLAAARAWNAREEKVAPEPSLVGGAVAAARATGDPVLLCGALDAAGIAALTAGRFREAHRVAAERVGLLPAMPRDVPYPAPEITDAFHMGSSCAVAAGDLPAALAAARLAAADDLIGERSPVAVSTLLPPLVLTGGLREALDHAPTLWGVCEQAGSPLAWVAPAVAAVALAHGLLGEEAGFRVWRARAERVAGAARSRYLASFAAFVDARIALRSGTADASPAELVDAAFADFPPQDWYRTYARAAGAELAVAAGLPDAAERLAAARDAAAESDWAAASLTRAAGRLHDDPGELSAAAEAWERIGARYERACTLLLIPGRLDEGRKELADMHAP